MGIHEHELKETLDATVSYMIDNGVIDSLVAAFNKEHPGAVIPAPKSYKAKQ